MRKTRDLLPSNLRNLDIRGFDDDKTKKKAESDKDETDDEEESEDEDEEEEDDKGGDGKSGTNTDGLKSALRKERAKARKLERENKALLKAQSTKDDKDKSDTDKAKDEAATEKTKNAKLAERLKDRAIDNAILKLAGKLKFKDVDDAVKLVDRGDIEFEQDEDDPAEVEVDEDSVKSALESLAKKKAHLIAAEGQTERSGSKFGGGKKSQKDNDEDKLAEQYPALARGRVPGRRQSSSNSS